MQRSLPCQQLLSASQNLTSRCTLFNPYLLFSVVGDAAPAVTKQKKGYKRKLIENGDGCCPPDAEPVILVTSEESSESRPVLRTNAKKKSRLSSDKMSPAYSPENEEQSCSPTTANNSLFNYFNKVDKSADAWTTPKPTVLKVKADIHDPPPADPEEKKKR